MNRLALPVVCAAALLAAACGAGSPTSAGSASTPSGSAASDPTAGDTGFPVDLQNCGRTLHFDSPPERIVSGWPTSTELLLQLGVGARLVGQYNTSNGTASRELAEQYARVPVLSPAAPSREQLAAARPDLIWADGEYLFDGQRLPTIDELSAQGTQVMVLSGFCGDDASGAEVADVHVDLEALGAVLGDPATAERVGEQLDQRLAAVAAKVQARPTVPVAMISQYEGSVYVYEGVYSDIARAAGATNVYAGTLPKGKYFGQLSVEDLTRKNPGTIVYLTTPGEDEQAVRAYLRKRLPTVDAVRRGQVVFVPQVDSTNARAVDGVEALAAALHR